jgi:hypothetical protein
MAPVMAVPQPKATGGMAVSHPLDAVFSPKSVAVLGVTATPETVPYGIFHSIPILANRHAATVRSRNHYLADVRARL